VPSRVEHGNRALQIDPGAARIRHGRADAVVAPVILDHAKVAAGAHQQLDATRMAERGTSSATPGPPSPGYGTGTMASRVGLIRSPFHEFEREMQEVMGRFFRGLPWTRMAGEPRAWAPAPEDRADGGKEIEIKIG
jgi:hypothetical protein